MDKLIRDGKVAVLISPGYGAGWSTDNPNCPEMLFDPTLVQMVLKDRPFHELKEYVETQYPEAYWGGLSDLKVEWIPEGTRFRVGEYDGSESIVRHDEDNWHVA